MSSGTWVRNYPFSKQILQKHLLKDNLTRIVIAKKYNVKISVIDHALTQFHLKSNLHRRHLTVKEASKKFWNLVEKTPTCWLWKGTIWRGYGTLRVSSNTWNGIGRRAHRIAWYLSGRSIPKNKLLCHKCDVRNCVNPNHLFVGTYLDNNRDMIAKGRSASGDRNGRRKHPERYPIGENVWNSKLTGTQVRIILNSPLDKSVLSKQFHVTPQNIDFIRNRKTWRHISVTQPA